MNEDLTRKWNQWSVSRISPFTIFKAIDKDILKSILSTNLKDLEEFCTTVLLHFKIAAA